MGSGSSFSYWTAEEQAENDRAILIMNKSKDFIVDFMYYGVPVRSGKKSWDPRSPLYYEVDPRVLQDAMLGKGEIERTLIEAVPSTVIVNRKGVIKILFTKEAMRGVKEQLENVEYTLSVMDINEAIKLENDPDAPFYIVPQPECPVLVKAEKRKLHLRWTLPQPPGISQQAELQFCHINPKRLAVIGTYLDKLEIVKVMEKEAGTKVYRDQDRDVYRDMDLDDDPYGLGKPPFKWFTLTSRHYYKTNFTSFLFDSLLPGDYYCFRLRYMNYRAWSAFSYPTGILQCAPDVPEAPAAPVATYVTSTAVQLFWVPPIRDNGRPIAEYILHGRSPGTEFVTLYKGSKTSFLATGLHPEFAYSFEVCAVNEVGASDYSLPCSVITPKGLDKPRYCDPDSFEWMMAIQFRDAWKELWDPKSEQVFYFNRITGTRQLEMPEALCTDVEQKEGEDGGGGAEGSMRIESAAEIAAKEETEFRKKRYRLLRALHNANARKSRVQPGGDNNSGGSPTTRATEFKNVKLCRDNLLGDAFRRIAKVPLSDMLRKIKFEFEGEEGIDSGGVGKEAFLLISKAAAIYAGPVHRGLFFVTDKQNGALFFNPEEEVLKRAAMKKANQESSSSEVDSPSKDSATPSLETGLGSPMSPSKYGPTVRIDHKSLVELNTVSNVLLCKFIGRLLAKAIFDRQLVDVPLSPLLLKHLLGKTSLVDKDTDAIPTPNHSSPTKGGNVSANSPHSSSAAAEKYIANKVENKSTACVSNDALMAESEQSEERISRLQKEVDKLDAVLEKSLDELQLVDKELHSSLKWMLENDITDIIYEKFSVNTGTFDSKTKEIVYKEVSLCPNGIDMDVDENNKIQYIQLLIRWRTQYAVKKFLNPFLEGFHEIVPLKVLMEHDIEPHELDLILNGRPEVDVDDLRAYCMYQDGGGYDDDREESLANADEDGVPAPVLPFGEQSEMVIWFWQALRDYSQSELRQVLSFFTGSGRVPLDGYDPPLNLTQGVDMDKDVLPRAHTCFNQFVLPPYSAFDVMKEKILYAARETQGFSLS